MTRVACGPRPRTPGGRPQEPPLQVVVGNNRGTTSKVIFMSAWVPAYG